MGRALSGPGTAVLLCTNGLREQSSRPARCPLSAGKPFSQSGQEIECYDYFKLVNGMCGLNHESVKDGEGNLQENCTYSI